MVLGCSPQTATGGLMSVLPEHSAASSSGLPSSVF